MFNEQKEINKLLGFIFHLIRWINNQNEKNQVEITRNGIASLTIFFFFLAGEKQETNNTMKPYYKI